jgi:hypothetical protein
MMLEKRWNSGGFLLPEWVRHRPTVDPIVSPRKHGSTYQSGLAELKDMHGLLSHCYLSLLYPVLMLVSELKLTGGLALVHGTTL